MPADHFNGLQRSRLAFRRKPDRSDCRISAQNERAVRARTAGVKESRNELAHAAIIGLAEPWPTEMIMTMNVQERDRITVSDCKDFPERTATNAGANVRITEVIVVRHWVPGLPEKQQPAIDKPRDAAA